MQLQDNSGEDIRFQNETISILARQVRNIHDLFFKSSGDLSEENIESAIDQAAAKFLLKRSLRKK
jgi:hypothetical protein